MRPLCTDEDRDVFGMFQDIDRSENDFRNDAYGLDYKSFLEWCVKQVDSANGRNLPYGYVPQSIYLLYVDDKPVGVGKIRWGLTEKSREAGGNVGYAVSKKCRGRGYGTILFAGLIDIARRGNLPEILATVTKYNESSKRIMEKCGGRLLKENKMRWYYTF